MRVAIAPRTILEKFLFFIVFLLFANIVVIFLKSYFLYEDVHGLTDLFNLDSEMSIPALFQSLTLALSTLLLLVIAAAHKRLGSSHLSWFGLAMVFLYLTIDEAAVLHERLVEPIRDSLNTSGLFYFAWVIPYIAALVIFCVLYFRFLLNLPRKTMILFIVSGIIYVSGALGLEMISGLRANLHGFHDLIYLFITTAEELLEMLGLAIFVYTLLSYLTEQFEELTIIIEEQPDCFIKVNTKEQPDYFIDYQRRRIPSEKPRDSILNR